MFVAAFIAGANISEHHRAGIEQGTAAVAAILERPFQHRGDGDAGMAFLEGAILRSGLTGELVQRPVGVGPADAPRPGGDLTGGEGAPRAMTRAVGSRAAGSSGT